MQSIVTMAVDSMHDIVEHAEHRPLIHPTKVIAQRAAMDIFMHVEGPGDCRGYGWKLDQHGNLALWYLGDGGWEPTVYSITERPAGWMVLD